MAASRHMPHLFKRACASYPRATEDMTMKLGLAIGYSVWSATSIDAMAGGGRFIVDLAVSGPQIVEGTYGQP